MTRHKLIIKNGKDQRNDVIKFYWWHDFFWYSAGKQALLGVLLKEAPLDASAVAIKSWGKGFSSD